ncbi:MAG: hypothetical protein AB8I08_03700 [Sandaracinaceae bacterium]
MTEMPHLDVVALEALATGREELVSEAQLGHLDSCAVCAARVAEEVESAADAVLGLKRAMPPIDDLDQMIARAMELAPAEAALATAAPSRRSLWMGAGIGGLLAAGLAVMSAPGLGVSGLGTAGSQVLTLARAADRIVESSLPGGWIGLAILGLIASLVLAVPTRLLLRHGSGSLVTGAAGALLLMVVALPNVSQAYRVDGSWPDPMPQVEIAVERQPTSEALRQAAASAGLGVVMELEDDTPVTMHLSGAPIDEVIEALLGERDVVVRPGASLLTIRPDPVSQGQADDTVPEEPPTDAVTPETLTAPVRFPPRAPAIRTIPWDPSSAPVRASPRAPATDAIPWAPAPPPIPPMPPTPPPALASAQNNVFNDLVTLGDDADVGREQRVRGVYTMGGDAQVLGHAYGDIVTMGGDASVDGEVVGNVTTMGGDIELGPAARVHGDLNAMGGSIEVHESAVLYGQIVGTGHTGDVHVGHRDGEESGVYRWALWNALLFLFGLLMLGAGRDRFSTLRDELAARPVRSTFGGLFGALGGGALALVFTLTIIGIPGAMVIGALLASGYVLGWGTGAYWLGTVLPLPGLKERPVAQLAVGVGVLFLVGLIPFVGSVLVTGAALAGLGAVISTSFGKNPRKPKRPSHTPTGPFRTSA